MLGCRPPVCERRPRLMKLPRRAPRQVYRVFDEAEFLTEERRLDRRETCPPERARGRRMRALTVLPPRRGARDRPLRSAVSVVLLAARARSPSTRSRGAQASPPASGIAARAVTVPTTGRRRDSRLRRAPCVTTGPPWRPGGASQASGRRSTRRPGASVANRSATTPSRPGARDQPGRPGRVQLRAEAGAMSSRAGSRRVAPIRSGGCACGEGFPATC